MKLAFAVSALAVGLATPALALAQYGTPQPYGTQPQYGSQPQYGTTQQQYGTQPQYGAPQQAGPQIQAGGLAPPPSSAARDPESWRTEEALQSAEQNDSGRGLEWFYLTPEIGVQHFGLQTFKGDKAVDEGAVPTTQTGLLVGAGMGVRLVFITIGPRFRFASFSKYQLWTLDLEAAFRIPLGRLEPYFGLSGGYAHVGGFDNVGDAKADAVSLRGLDVRAGGGLDYYITPVFSAGANVSFDLFALSRPAVSSSDLTNAAQNVYAKDGSSIGAGISATAVLGLHF